MKLKELGSIRNTVIGFALIILCFVAASIADAAPIDAVQDTRQPDTQCINGLFAVGECPEGYSLILFEESFDSRADWQTTTKNTMTVPDGWDAGRTDEQWHPATESGTQPSMMINGDDISQIYGETGKAFITYSESYDDTSNNGFTSDGILTKDITPSSEVYAKFNVKFQAGWAANDEGGQIKLIRFSHWDGENSGTGERYKFFSSGNSAPIYIYDWAQNDYGLRHFHAFRCDSQTDNYYCSSPSILNPPRAITTGDMSVNYTTELTSTNPEIVDLVNGGFVARAGSTYHNNVFGDGWHTIELHLKLNSAAGVQDGVLQYWLDGEKIISMNQIAWIGAGGDINAKWNNISIGGNDRYHFDLVGAPADRERWYAIDNILVMSELPLELQ